MADRPEPLRLFDPDPAAGAHASQPETTTQPSRSETQTPSSRPDTDDRRPDHELLRAAAESAKLESNARMRLDTAVETARAAGHSWRALGIATGIPHQTLHRRSRQAGSQPLEEEA